MSGPARTTSYLPAEELLARYPGRAANISAALAACYIANGEPVPLHLLDGAKLNYNSSSREAEEGK